VAVFQTGAEMLNCELNINEDFLTNIVAFHPQQAVVYIFNETNKMLS